MRPLRVAVILAALCALILPWRSHIDVWVVADPHRSSVLPWSVAPPLHKTLHDHHSLPPPLPPKSVMGEGRSPPSVNRRERRAAQPLTKDYDAAKSSDPRKVNWGRDAVLHGPPPAIVLFAPHKTGSTFFTSLLHDVAELLGLCWYTDNAAFMYAPPNHSKCASPSCGHSGSQRRFSADDRGWGDCTGFAVDKLRVASACIERPRGSERSAYGLRGHCGHGKHSQTLPAALSAQNGVALGVVRLPEPMRQVIRVLGSPPWQWYVILHQRDPGDTLVSGYHSFGWTHPAAPSASDAQKRQHAAIQASIRNVSVDEYVISKAADLRSKYAPYFELNRTLQDGSSHASGIRPVVVMRSRYEQLVTAFPRWLDVFVDTLKPSYTQRTLDVLKRELLRRHRKSFKATGGHRRSVKPGRFTAEVQPETTQELRRVHGVLWQQLGY